jgi:hypothetical protein
MRYQTSMPRLFRKEIKKGLRIMARDDVIRSILVHIASRRNSYSQAERREYPSVLKLSLQKTSRQAQYGLQPHQRSGSDAELCARIFGVGSDSIVACGLQD